MTGSDEVATRWQRVTATLFRRSALTLPSLMPLEALFANTPVFSHIPRSGVLSLSLVPLSFQKASVFPVTTLGSCSPSCPCLLPLLATPSVGRQKLLLSQTSKSCVSWKLSRAGDRVPLASACHQSGWGPAALHDERLLACFMSPSQMS